MLTAITRSVSVTLDGCELAYLDRQSIDVVHAAGQHRAYEQCLRDLGVSVTSLPAEADLPDAVFVEDPAVVLDEVAVMTRMGAGSRRPESESVAAALAPWRRLHWMTDPATMDGGDVMRVGRTIYVGASSRTNAEGIRQLSEMLSPFGYTVCPVEVTGCLHLKTACTYLGDDVLLVNRAWVNPSAFQGLRLVAVAPEEPWGANVLAVGETRLMPDSFPATADIVRGLGWKVRTVDISELMKAEAGVTCMSLIFNS